MCYEVGKSVFLPFLYFRLNLSCKNHLTPWQKLPPPTRERNCLECPAPRLITGFPRESQQMLKLQINLTFPETCLKTRGLARIQILGLEVTEHGCLPVSKQSRLELCGAARGGCGFA